MTITIIPRLLNGEVHKLSVRHLPRTWRCVLCQILFIDQCSHQLQYRTSGTMWRHNVLPFLDVVCLLVGEEWRCDLPYQRKGTGGGCGCCG